MLDKHSPHLTSILARPGHVEYLGYFPPHYCGFQGTAVASAVKGKTLHVKSFGKRLLKSSRSIHYVNKAQIEVAKDVKYLLL